MLEFSEFEFEKGFHKTFYKKKKYIEKRRGSDHF